MVVHHSFRIQGKAWLTHWHLGDVAVISQVYFSNSFYELISWALPVELGFRLMQQNAIDDKSTLIQVMAWCHQATYRYLSQWWPISLSSYCDAIWQHIPVSTLVQVMACCLMASWSVHYLDQCWLLITCLVRFCGIHMWAILLQVLKLLQCILYNEFENYSFKITSTSSSD